MAGIAWYQKKIGAYDQQIWEKSLEQTEFKGFGSKPKKTGHIKPDLIDVDFVRGSTFSKAKPESPWTALTRKGLVRVLFFPFFFQWWIQVTSKSISTLILVLYFLQVAGAVLYFEVPAACASEVVGPLCLMLLLGTVHCQIVSTESSRSPDNSPVPSRTASPVRRKRLSYFCVRFVRESHKGPSVFFFSHHLTFCEACSLINKYSLLLRECIQEENNGKPTDAPVLPREVKLLRPSEGSRPASDTDDMLWEELLHDPDSASTGSSESGEEEPHSPNHSLPLPNITLTSDEDEALPQHQFSWLQACHPSKDHVSVIIWEQGECKKADMSVLEISGIILTRVKVVEQGMGYLLFGSLVTASLALLPYCFRLAQKLDVANLNSVSLVELPAVVIGPPCGLSFAFFIITAVERVFLSGLFFFMMCVAERTYKQRLLFAKLFSHITSARKAKKSEIPHFRLKKVQNIKMWLSLRSFLKVSPSHYVRDALYNFLIRFLLFLHLETNWELMVWCAALMVFLLRLATLGAETNRKYSNASVLLTEQINLYLKMEKKPNKKDQLNIVNNVLRLATKLLKELDTPFRLLGLTVNPLIYNITRVVILSAISAAVSDLLGFNIRLWKIKP
uniref:Putative homeodomain transcription factor 1 n=1 Tax=Cyprinus carpio carpio TaxID=630221 RepID=A0A9J7Y219_CYPCA